MKILQKKVKRSGKKPIIILTSPKGRTILMFFGICLALAKFLGSMLPECMVLCISFVGLFHPKKFYDTSKQGRRLRFGMLTVLTNIRSIKLLHHASCIIHHASCISYQLDSDLKGH